MKFLLAALVAASTTASSPPPQASLLGEWRSDRELTMSFIRQNVRLEKKTEDFLDSLMGHMVVTFTEGNVSYVMPDVEVMVKDKKRPFKGINESVPYQVLYTSERVVVISSPELFTGKTTTTTYNFDSNDVMWVYTGGADSALPDSHYREYFRRSR